MDSAFSSSDYTPTSTQGSTDTPPILTLPHELLFEVISLIPDTPSLLSLALSCRTLSTHVVPYHTDYRVLHIRTLNPIVFAHLARRTDLTRNIREVHISEKHNYSRGDRMPTRLVDMSIDGNPSLNGAGVPGPEGERIKTLNVCRALRAMVNLEVFTWEWSGVWYQDPMGQRKAVRPTTEARFENAILGEVVRKGTVKHFGLSGPFGMGVDGPNAEGRYDYPVWHLSNLTSLELSGDVWLRTANILPMCVMLSRFPNLEHLSIPLEFKHLPILSFPKLKRAKLTLVGGATSTIDASATAFIHNHPSIEELSWYPIGVPSLRKGALPHLRKLKSTLGVVQALAEGDAREDEDMEQGQVATVPLTPATTSTPPATVLSIPSGKKSKRLSVIRETDEPEEGPSDDGEDDHATPVAPRPLPLREEDEDATPSSPSSPTAQYFTYPSLSSSHQSSSPNTPTLPVITISAPPSTPTGIDVSQHTPSFRRYIESLDVLSLSASFLLSTAPQIIDPLAVREVNITSFGDFQELYDLATVFPNIKWLSLPAIHLPRDGVHPVPWTREEVLDVLPRFGKVEVVRGGALWRAAALEEPEESASAGEESTTTASTKEERTKQRMHELMILLVQCCPKLKEVDHCEWYERREGFKRVVVDRRMVRKLKTDGDGDVSMEEEEVEEVSYGVKRPFVKRFFEVMGGVFA